MFYGNPGADPRGYTGGASVKGLRETPGRVWSTARNGLRSRGSAPTTRQMMSAAEVSGVRSAVVQTGESNGTVSKMAKMAGHAQNAYQGIQKLRGMGSSGAEAAATTGAESAAVAGGEAVAAEGAVAGGEALAAAGGLEAAGLAADATGVGLPVGLALGAAGLVVGMMAMKHHNKGGANPDGPDPTSMPSISMSLRAPNAFNMKRPTKSF